MNSSGTTNPSAALPAITPQTRLTQAGAVEYADFGTGPVVVALHGAMGGWDQSTILAQCAVPAGFRVLALSRPGYLGTPFAAGRSPEQQADLVAALLDALGIARAAVIAISGGGPCALAFALRHPGRCDGLALISTCSVKNDARIPVSFHIMKAMARVPFVVRAMGRRALANPAKSLERAIADSGVRRRLLADAEVMALYTALLASTFHRMGERITGTDNDIRITFTTELPLERIQVPALVVHGTADKVAPYRRHVPPFAARLPGVRVCTVEGGEHVTLFTHRERVRAEVGAFLKAHLAR